MPGPCGPGPNGSPRLEVGRVDRFHHLPEIQAIADATALLVDEERSRKRPNACARANKFDARGARADPEASSPFNRGQPFGAAPTDVARVRRSIDLHESPHIFEPADAEKKREVQPDYSGMRIATKP